MWKGEVEGGDKPGTENLWMGVGNEASLTLVFGMISGLIEVVIHPGASYSVSSYI
jgi:hypothetical protein